MEDSELSDSELVPCPRQGTTASARPGMVFSPARLRAWRHARNRDHAALADAAGVTVDQVAACEAGRADPTPGMIAAWSALLGCTPEQLRSTTPADPAEYWSAANQAMPRMSGEDLAVVARVFVRVADRVNRSATGQRDQSDR